LKKFYLHSEDRFVGPFKNRLSTLLHTKDAVFQPPFYWISTGIPVSTIDATTELKNNVQSIMNKTCISSFIGIGRDSHGLQHKGFQVIRVQRIENQVLWRNYVHKRDLLSTVKTRNEVKVSFSPWWMNYFQLHKESNEVILFHGTKSNITDFIVQQGFEERVAMDNGLFGAGIYFAENSSKSDEYITPDANGECNIFLCRVCLGTPFVTTQTFRNTTQPIRRPPCVHGHIDSCQHERTDSVIAECKRTGPQYGFYDLERYREFIVYDRSQCYPELLITFKRVSIENPV